MKLCCSWMSWFLSLALSWLLTPTSINRLSTAKAGQWSGFPSKSKKVGSPSGHAAATFCFFLVVNKITLFCIVYFILWFYHPFTLVLIDGRQSSLQGNSRNSFQRLETSCKGAGLVSTQVVLSTSGVVEFLRGQHSLLSRLLMTFFLMFLMNTLPWLIYCQFDTSQSHLGGRTLSWENAS